MASSCNLDIQVGGNHYKKYKIQPIEFFMANGTPYAEAAIMKYVMRYKDKGGIEDLKKAKHLIDLLVDECADKLIVRVFLTDGTFEDLPVSKLPSQYPLPDTDFMEWIQITETEWEYAVFLRGSQIDENKHFPGFDKEYYVVLITPDGDVLKTCLYETTCTY